MKTTTIFARTVAAATFCGLLTCGTVNADVSPRSIKSQFRTSDVALDRSFVDGSISHPRPNITPPPPTRHDPTPGVQPPIALILAAGSKSAIDSDDDSCEGAATGICASASGHRPKKGNFYIQEFSMFYVVGSGIRLPDDVAEF